MELAVRSSKEFFSLVRSAMRCFLLTLSTAVLFAMGCSSLEPRIGPQLVYRDLEIHRAQMSILEAPDTSAAKPLTAAIMPFTLLQKVNDPTSVGSAVTSHLAGRWSRDRVFLRTTVLEGSGGMQAAPGGTDLIVTGTIPYLFVSGGKGTTAVALQVRIHDARTGRLLWSMDHAGSMTAGIDQDYILVQTRPRPSMDPVAEVTDVLAREMGDVLRKWSWAGTPPLPAESLHIEKEPTRSERLRRWFGSLRLVGS
jgi:OmpA-OmpF porin, OOP family